MLKQKQRVRLFLRQNRAFGLLLQIERRAIFDAS
jgi:hypothetical protein